MYVIFPPFENGVIEWAYITFLKGNFYFENSVIEWPHITFLKGNFYFFNRKTLIDVRYYVINDNALVKWDAIYFIL